MARWCFFLLFASMAQAFLVQMPGRFHRGPVTKAIITVGSASEIPPGERKIIDTEAGAVIVANVGGEFYAVNAKCPHLGLPMKRGAIESGSGGPTITCNFHKSASSCLCFAYGCNSKFSLTDGTCKVWSESVFGIPGTGALGGIVGSIGGAKNSPATVYKVENEEGTLKVNI